MNTEHSQVLEFPAMLYDTKAATRRKVGAEGRWWAREYLKTGAFPLPREMRQVPPGEVLVMHAGAEGFDWSLPRWRMHVFIEVFMYLDERVPKEERPRMRDAFESFCLSTPWGALDHAVSPPPLRSAERMAKRLAAVLRFWEVLQGLRYAFWSFDQKYTLEELMEDIYRRTLEAWCPGGPASVREHMALTVERMSRATREDCVEALLRMIPSLVAADAEFKHREVLSDPGFLRERLSALPSKDFEDFSSAYKYTVTVQLAAWDRALGRH
ncbi:hypothetical protein ATI61_112115 [Archangium gephyra]|uniref:Uncharacterized protein n=1 Tax=Archangium gephyra TaxID=48 RepID=A0AAC8Q4M3_9BACT|nr:hypothetical protein [Archangium gephyra]AKJ00854.1 Hypothetical protein AA314_02480 [Archangium gephyra]REG26020.1 hypothetical protein ATI61_112115 [Archangium gephyra]